MQNAILTAPAETPAAKAVALTIINDAGNIPANACVFYNDAKQVPEVSPVPGMRISKLRFNSDKKTATQRAYMLVTVPKFSKSILYGADGTKADAALEMLIAEAQDALLRKVADKNALFDCVENPAKFLDAILDAGGRTLNEETITAWFTDCAATILQDFRNRMTGKNLSPDAEEKVLANYLNLFQNFRKRELGFDTEAQAKAIKRMLTEILTNAHPVRDAMLSKFADWEKAMENLVDAL